MAESGSTENEGNLSNDLKKTVATKEINHRPFIKSLELFNKQQNVKYQNILNEFSDSREFVINGDGLVYEMMKDNNYDDSCGGQFLHFTYICERFLLDLIQKGGVICVAFFSDFNAVWMQYPNIFLARESLRIHLENNTNIRVITTPNPWHKDWKRYLNDLAPTFLITMDTCKYPLSKGEMVNHSHPEIILFAVQQMFFLSQQLNLSFFNNIQVYSNLLMGFYIPASARHRAFIQKLNGPLKALWAEVLGKCCGDKKGYALSPSQKTWVLEKVLVKAQAANIRELVGAVAVGLTVTEKTNISFLKIFVLHLIVISHTSVKSRAQAVNSKVWKSHGLRLLDPIQTYMAHLLSIIVSSMRENDKSNEKKLVCPEVADMMDGRILTRLLVIAIQEPALLEESSLSSAVATQFRFLWEEVVVPLLPEHSSGKSAFPIENLHELKGTILVEVVEAEQSDGTPPDSTPSLLPMDCPLVHLYVGDLREQMDVGDIDVPEVRHSIKRGQDFDEKHHWHCTKPLSDEFDRTKDTYKENEARTDKWRMKGKQKMSEYMQWYGETLGGGTGSKITIVTEKKSAQSKPKSAISHSAKQKNKGTGKKEEYIEANKSRLQGKDLEKEKIQWDKIWSDLQPSLQKENYAEVLKQADKFLESSQVEKVKKKANFERLKILWKVWSLQCERHDRDFGTSVRIMQTIQGLCTSSVPPNEREREKLALYAGKLGFEDQALLINPNYTAQKDCSIYSVGMSTVRFQLHHMGHYLKRDQRVDKDPRVSAFIPDTWQREMLDIVDRNQSALIVAPTSSGKTYASYYCIEKVLRESDTGIVVYVAPTKALVNQVAATVYARFNKNLPDGQALHGVFTRDYRTNATNSQVLITVPQCLEILMLSPSRQKWVKRIKYVIFDEVHCLGMEIGAEVWEHMLMMIRCPFLALSATIENPQDLQQWLQQGESMRLTQDREMGKLREGNENSYRVKLVIFNERYADLEKQVFFPDVSDEDEDVHNDDQSPFVSLHPLVALTKDKLNIMTCFPDALSFSAKECIEAYDAMVTFWPDSRKEEMQKLKPELYFEDELKSKLWLRRAKAREYEQDLKEELITWKLTGNLEKLEAVIEHLGSGFNEVHQENLSKYVANTEDEESMDFVQDHVDQLLEKLNQENKLPALVFSFNRSACENMTQEVVVSLLEKEKELKELKSVQHLVKLLETKCQGMQKMDKIPRDDLHKRSVSEQQMNYGRSLENLDRDIDDARLAASRHVSHYLAKQAGKEAKEVSVLVDMMSPTDPLPGCSYICKGAMSAVDVDRVLNRVPPGLFHHGIHRGIVYHHAGMGNKMRSAAEILFRKKHVQAVVATGTLALGIHMPCKSVIFAGDSPFLNSMYYRQMSGRSGRRGFDEVGNVYFYGLSLKKVKHLMSSKLTKLTGNFPVQLSLVLRLYLLCNRSEDKETAVNMALTLLKNPLLAQENPSLKEQIRHFFLFSTEFLMRKGMLDEEGNPQGLAGLVTHLHYHEPANFVFAAMLHAECFHKLCKPRNEDGSFPQEVMDNLLIVLANLFSRHPLHPDRIKEMKARSKNSRILMPQMPEYFKNEQKRYNQAVVAVFNNYMQKAAEVIAREHSEETRLPLSGADYSKSEGKTDELQQTLEQTANKYKVTSIFAALSGHTDADLWTETSNFNNIRPGVYCEEDVMPILPLNPTDRQGNPIQYGAAVIDFYNHGSNVAIMRDYGLMSGDVFNMTLDFSFTIKAIAVSLWELGPDHSVDIDEGQTDNVVAAFQQLKREYSEIFRSNYKKDI